jgi:hypothetical protein
LRYRQPSAGILIWRLVGKLLPISRHCLRRGRCDRNLRAAAATNRFLAKRKVEAIMQASQVKEYFPSVDRSIDHAAQLCQLTNNVPDYLRSCLAELDRESEEAKQVFADALNDDHIVQCVNRLEKLGDRAWQACEEAGNAMDRGVQQAVRDAHDAIADLKHRLH